jgi:hypothetical protein
MKTPTNRIQGNKHYLHLLIMVVLHFIAMYVLMYSMVDRFDNVYANHNQLYMAGLMTSPMVLIEISIMRAMFMNKKLNVFVMAIGIIAAIGFFTFIRQQAAISDKQFLKSMIPHHGGAILMCGRASILDPEIKELCRTILSGQQSEIDQMKAILSRLEP